MKHHAAFGLIALAGAAVDLLTKHLAFRYIQPNEADVVFIPGFFHYNQTLNKGIVFGLGQSAGPVFLVVSILAVPVIIAIYASLKKPKWVMTAALGLILAGTIGNMYDRVTVGAVRDFIKFFYAPGKVWPLFNLADSHICVGVALLTVEMIFFDEKKPKKKEAAEPAAAAPAPPPPAETAGP